MGVSIVTDSGNDLSVNEAGRFGIHVVPIWIVLGKDRMRDGVDIDRARYFRRVGAGEVPTTESPTEEQYREIFTKLVGAGDDVIVVTLSSKISKSLANATAAAASFGSRIHFVDSLGSHGLETLLCYYARELLKTGLSAAEVAKQVDPKGLKRAIFFILRDPNTLVRTGRLPPSVVGLTKMPNISIALRMNDEGVIVAGGQSFSIDKTRDLMVDAVLRSIGHSPNAWVSFGHIQDEPAALEVQKLFHTKLGQPAAKEYIHESSMTIAVHQGIGSVSMCAIVPH